MIPPYPYTNQQLAVVSEQDNIIGSVLRLVMGRIRLDVNSIKLQYRFFGIKLKQVPVQEELLHSVD
jgi:hypothetical protein